MASLGVVLICIPLIVNGLLAYSWMKVICNSFFLISMFVSFDHFPLGYGSSQFLNLFILKGLVLCDMNCKYFFLTLSNAF